ncbi:hypothetical protein [Xanthocytophaga flava]|uniref:hypothetical protein n=1 Tax=Xanthocytophaga flava TaxID=3048013 RepID=UPI0028D30BD2|nr:hypothetical protein [Xanthocytophaga flavus]MDJ1473650.1 hypothetical protein [Xanthocytophaga flavus]
MNYRTTPHTVLPCPTVLPYPKFGSRTNLNVEKVVVGDKTNDGNKNILPVLLKGGQRRRMFLLEGQKGERTKKGKKAGKSERHKKEIFP